jgi:hypothetical protein
MSIVECVLVHTSGYLMAADRTTCRISPGIAAIQHVHTICCSCLSSSVGHVP